MHQLEDADPDANSPIYDSKILGHYTMKTTALEFNFCGESQIFLAPSAARLKLTSPNLRKQDESKKSRLEYSWAFFQVVIPLKKVVPLV